MMEYIKILKDYSKNIFEKQLAIYLANSVDTSICEEPVKNRDFILKNLKPKNDFIIYSTAVACEDKKENINQ